MKIILAEVLAGGQQQPEKSFNENIIRIGRDAGECQITFESSQYPMVSRRHAELRFEGGQWILHDLNSSFGTSLNGQKVTQPQTRFRRKLDSIRLGRSGFARCLV